jgi:hypothetical protein
MSEQEPLIIGVFDQVAEARQALDELRRTGFSHDDLGLALREGGAPTNNLVQDLMQLGLPREQAEFYYHEMQAGKAIASIRTGARALEVRNLLQRSGAYDYASAQSRAASEQPPQGQ